MFLVRVCYIWSRFCFRISFWTPIWMKRDGKITNPFWFVKINSKTKIAKILKHLALRNHSLDKSLKVCLLYFISRFHPVFTCSKSTVETTEICMKHIFDVVLLCLSLTLKGFHSNCWFRASKYRLKFWWKERMSILFCF